MQTRSSWIWCWIIGAVLASSASAQVYVSLIDNLPTCIGNRNGRIISVSDAVDDSDCSVGGATGENRFVHPCICDTLNALGPYWKAVGGGSGGAGDVLLAGDADGQTIQGITGANQARVDIGVTDASGVRLIGTGATPGFIYAYTDGVFASSPDLGTSFDLYDGGIDFSTDGSFSIAASVDGTPETTSRFSVNTSGVSVEIQDGLQQYEVTASSGFNFAGTRFRFNVPAPTNANDACFPGMVAWDSSHFYVCIATDTWVRVAMATW